MKYFTRGFNEREKPKHLKFSLNYGDIVIHDGLYHLITGFGIYDDQYWTERLYEDGFRLAASNYETLKEKPAEKNTEIINKVISSYCKTIEEFYTHFFGDSVNDDIERHLSQLKGIIMNE